MVDKLFLKSSILYRLWKEHPLLIILVIAIIPRIVAVIFSKGYGMHDDHFGPIEQPFIIMHDITYWTSRDVPHGHSIVYPTIHFLLFNLFEAINISDPQSKMYIVRFLHALYSLLIIVFGYKIAKILSDDGIAKKVGIILALFWAFPFLSVRNLIEVVCIPPLFIGFYYILLTKNGFRNSIIAGLWFGLAFVFRYQTLMITGTIGIILLFQKQIKELSMFIIGFIITTIVIQGSADIFAWGYPFASFVEYVRYNLGHSYDYTTGPWYNYTLLVLGALIPPSGFFIIYGFLRNWEKTIIIFFPVMIFFILHSYFPNKQERFIFPVVPIILVLGIIGWEEYIRKSKFWLSHKKLLKCVWLWFWIVNIILLITFTTYYSKKSRVEAMYTLYGEKVNGIILVGGKWGIIQPPLYYTGTYPIPIYQIINDESYSQVGESIKNLDNPPNYAIIFGSDELDERIKKIEKNLNSKLLPVQTIEPSFLDDVFYRLNPRYNKNQTTFVYKVEKN